MRRLIIVGCGNFALAAHYYFVHDSHYEVVAFTVDAGFLKENSFRGLPVVPFEEVQERYPPEGHDIFVAVGLRDVNRRRAAKLLEAEAKGYRLATYVSSRAIVPVDFRAEPNTWIQENVNVQPFVSLGRNTVVWGHSMIGFQSRVGDHCWFAAAVVGESVTVGEGTFVGIGANLASFVKVGRHNVIGAGANILNDTRDFEIYRGHRSTPSRVPSTRFTKFNG